MAKCSWCDTGEMVRQPGSEGPWVCNNCAAHAAMAMAVDKGGPGDREATRFEPLRGQVLLDAHKIINGERQNVYGNPEDSFALIARYWQTYLAVRVDEIERERSDGGCTKFFEITASDVALMMVLFKIAREANQHKLDNIVDASGYLGIYGDMQGS